MLCFLTLLVEASPGFHHAAAGTHSHDPDREVRVWPGLENSDELHVP